MKPRSSAPRSLPESLASDPVASWHTLVRGLLLAVICALVLQWYVTAAAVVATALARNAMRDRADAWVGWVVGAWVGLGVWWLLAWWLAD